MPGNVLITASSLPSDYCWTGPQQYLQDIVPLMSGNFTRAGTGINYGNDLPLAENRDKPWIRSNVDGTPDDVYHFINGLWLARFRIETPSYMPYPGTLLSIATLHGGEDIPVADWGDYAGPFWKKMDEFDGRSPMGPGTLPSGHVLNIGDNYGSEEFSLTALNLPEHYHEIIGDSDGAIGGGDGGWVIGKGPAAAGTPARDGPASATNPRVGRTENAGELAADIDPISNVHPVRGIWMIERTGRLYKRIIP